jgi:hypothetical protein
MTEEDREMYLRWQKQSFYDEAKKAGNPEPRAAEIRWTNGRATSSRRFSSAAEPAAVEPESQRDRAAAGEGAGGGGEGALSAVMRPAVISPRDVDLDLFWPCAPDLPILTIGGLDRQGRKSRHGTLHAVQFAGGVG